MPPKYTETLFEYTRRQIRNDIVERKRLTHLDDALWSCENRRESHIDAAIGIHVKRFTTNKCQRINVQPENWSAGLPYCLFCLFLCSKINDSNEKPKKIRRSDNLKPSSAAIAMVSLIAAPRVFSSFWKAADSKRIFVSQARSIAGKWVFFFVCPSHGIQLWLHFRRRLTARCYNCTF